MAIKPRILIFDNKKIVFHSKELLQIFDFVLNHPDEYTTTEIADKFNYPFKKLGCSIRRIKQITPVYFKPTKKWNKGLKKEDHEALMRIAKRTKEIKAGVKLSLSHRLKISEAHKKIINWNYKNGAEPENKRIRKSLKYKLWREAVYSRDNYTCQKCKAYGGNLHPHHILNFSEHIRLRFDTKNGVTLCSCCHRFFHKKYGQVGNNRQQLDSYLNI